MERSLTVLKALADLFIDFRLSTKKIAEDSRADIKADERENYSVNKIPVINFHSFTASVLEFIIFAPWKLISVLSWSLDGELMKKTPAMFQI